MKPLLCVFAHPDDEAFGPGGSIAKFAKERPVYIICVTKGDARTEFQTQEYQDLSEVRRNELLASAKVLGVKQVDFLNYHDGNLCNNLYHEIAGLIQTEVEKYRPDTLLTFENRGVSGHVDHIAVSLITSYVFERTPYVKSLLYYCESKDFTDQVEDYFIYFPSGFKKKDVDMVVDISPVWETQVKAMNAHKSQQKDIDMILKIRANLPKEEFFLKMDKEHHA